jgi:hypothetical protein
VKSLLKYTVFIILFAASLKLQVSGTDDKYGFKFIESKVYTGKTDIWVYDILKNDQVLRKMNVYVNTGFDGSRILVDFDFNTSWNMYYISNKRPVDNFWDSFRLREFTVNSLQEAVDLAVDHYIQDQVIKQ